MRVREKEREKYQDLKREIGNSKMVEVVPVVIGALGSVTKRTDLIGGLKS